MRRCVSISRFWKRCKGTASQISPGSGLHSHYEHFCIHTEGTVDAKIRMRWYYPNCINMRGNALNLLMALLSSFNPQKYAFRFISWPNGISWNSDMGTLNYSMSTFWCINTTLLQIFLLSSIVQAKCLGLNSICFDVCIVSTDTSLIQEVLAASLA